MHLHMHYPEGREVEKRRIDARMTVSELALCVAGLSEHELICLENGVRPSVYTQRILDALGTKQGKSRLCNCKKRGRKHLARGSD